MSKKATFEIAGDIATTIVKTFALYTASTCLNQVLRNSMKDTTDQFLKSGRYIKNSILR